MRRRRTARPWVLIAAAAAVLAVNAGPASAKGITGLSVCGAHGCVDRSDELGTPRQAIELLEGGPSVAEPDPAPFVRLRERMGDGGETFGTTSVVFLPVAGLQRFEDGTWRRTPPGALARLRHLARGIARLPAARLTPHRTSGPSVPEARPAVAVVSPTAAVDARDGGGGASGTALAAAAAVLLAGGVAATVVARRHRRPPRRPAIE
jgi:hypothetical protein